MSSVLEAASVEEIRQHITDLRAVEKWHRDQHSDSIADLACMHWNRLLNVLIERTC